jgi:hypothetical protein
MYDCDECRRLEAAEAAAWRRMKELQPTPGVHTTPETLIAFNGATKAHEGIKAERTAHLKNHSSESAD